MENRTQQRSLAMLQEAIEWSDCIYVLDWGGGETQG